MAIQYITQTDPYSIPAGFTETKTPQGGTAYSDTSGNIYTRDSGGFRLFSPTGDTLAAASKPPTITSSTDARTKVAEAQQGIQNMTPPSLGSYPNVQEGGTVQYNGQTYTKMPDGSFQMQGESIAPKVNSNQNTQNNGKTATVVSYVDNPDGTTTNYLSDGTSSTVKYSKNADGSLTPTEIQGTPKSAEQITLEKSYTDANIQLQQDATDLQAKYDQVKTNMSAALARQIDGIKQNYANAIAEQAKVNNAYLNSVTQSTIRGGQQRYEQDTASGQVMAEATAGLNRITKLEQDRDTLIAQAESAKTAKDWEMFYQTYGSLQDNRKEQAANIKSQFELSQKFLENAQKAALDKLNTLKITQDIGKNTIDSIGSIAMATLAEYEKANDEQGAITAIQDLAGKYGIDPMQLLSKAKELQGKEKSWSEPYTDPNTHQVLQRNMQTGEIRSVYNQPASGGATSADSIGQLLATGNVVPSLLGMGNKQAAIAAADAYMMENEGKHYNAAREQIKYEAAKRFATSLNSTQMVKFQGLAGSVVNTIDEVRNLANNIKLGGVVPMNRLEMEAYVKLNGNSPEAQTISQYLAATNTLKEEFANLVNGGYAPTEAAFSLANKQINENYGVDQLNASLSEVQRLINYRVGAFSDLHPILPGGYSDSGGGGYDSYLQAIGQ